MTRRTIEYVRVRAGFACEYCGTDEEGAGGELTIDHFHPRSQGGIDDPANLIYACARCNDYKADYWPSAEECALWNPRVGDYSAHFSVDQDGTLQGLTDSGKWTISRLRLNRPELVQQRAAKRDKAEDSASLERYASLLEAVDALLGSESELNEQHLSGLRRKIEELRKLQ